MLIKKEKKSAGEGLQMSIFKLYSDFQLQCPLEEMWLSSVSRSAAKYLARNKQIIPEPVCALSAS